MFGYFFSKLFKRKGCFTLASQAEKSNHLQPQQYFTEDGQPLIFIDGRLTDRELKDKYGDIWNS